MKKYILFDLDGTLTDSKEGITKSVQYALKKFGIEEDCENLTSFIGPPLLQSFMEFYNFDMEKSQLAIKHYRQRYADVGVFENKTIDGMADLLQKLKELGYVLAVATSKPTNFAIQICDKFELSKYLDLIVGSELDGTRSKKSEVIFEVMNQLKVNPKDVIMIGDRKHDIIGAKEAGVKSIGVTFGYAKDNELEEAGADFIVDTPKELLDCILKYTNDNN